MRCAHPACNRGIGLVSHRRGWFDKRLYCSKTCRLDYERRQLLPASDTSLVEWLLALPSAPMRPAPAPIPATLRVRAR